MEPVARHDSYLHLLRAAVRRHLVLVTTVTLVALAASFAFAQTLPAKYTATATVLPRPVTGNPLAPGTSATNGTQLTVAMETEAGLVDTPRVAALATKSLGRPVPATGDTVVATVPPNTQIIRIAYTSKTAVGAQQGAQAMAEAFLSYREEVAVAAQHETLTSLQREAESSAAALQQATRAAAKNTDPRSFAAQQVILYGDRLATLNDNLSATRALSTNPGVVVTSAALPMSPKGMNPLLVVVGGGLLGLVVAVLIAVRLEWRRDVVDASNEYDVGGVPLLTKLPVSATRGPRLVTDDDPDDLLPEAYRKLRSGVIAVAEPPTVLAVSCVSATEPAGHVVANLGVTLAQAGFRVSVVVADPFDRSAEALLGGRLEPGLSDVLRGGSDLDHCVQALHGVSLVAGGAEPEKARDLYAGPRLGATMAALKSRSDYVVVAAAGTSSSDAEAVALACDAVLVVVNDGLTTHADTISALDRFRRLDVAMVGAVSIPHHGREGHRRGRSARNQPESSKATTPDPLPGDVAAKRPMSNVGPDA